MQRQIAEMKSFLEPLMQNEIAMQKICRRLEQEPIDIEEIDSRVKTLEMKQRSYSPMKQAIMLLDQKMKAIYQQRCKDMQ